MRDHQIAIIGLGYVGLTVSACLSDLGHKIIGLDRDQDKIDRLNNPYNAISLYVLESFGYTEGSDLEELMYGKKIENCIGLYERKKLLIV